MLSMNGKGKAAVSLPIFASWPFRYSLVDFVAQDVQILDAIIEPFEVIAQKLQKPF